MKLKNISNKVIGVDNRYVMPDETVDITEETASLPAMKHYVRLGLVSLTEDVKPEVKAPAEVDIKIEPAATETEEKAAPAVKRTRKKAAKTTDE